MSDPVRVALVAEGPTDWIVVEAVLRAILLDRDFVLTHLQPEGSLAFGHLGTGWVGVYRCCKQSALRGAGRLSGDAVLFAGYDLVVLHLDADVAARRYGDGSIVPSASDGALPCEQACPPASATTDALRAVLLSWCGEAAPPARSVVCMPSKSTDAWVVAALFPDDQAVDDGIECHSDPASRLGVQRRRDRIEKSQRAYRARAAQITAAWPRIGDSARCGEALRFDREFREALAATAGDPEA